MEISKNNTPDIAKDFLSGLCTDIALLLQQRLNHYNRLLEIDQNISPDLVDEILKLSKSTNLLFGSLENIKEVKQME